MTFSDIVLAVLYVAVALALGRKVWVWLDGLGGAPKSSAVLSPEDFLSPENPPPPSALSFSHIDGAIGKLLKRIEAGKFDIPDTARSGIVQRMREVLGLLQTAQDALQKSAPDALAKASGALATAHYITGAAWQNHLAGIGLSYAIVQSMTGAFRSDARSIVNEMTRLLAERPASEVQKNGDLYTLACAVCGADAMTYEYQDGKIGFQTLSPVNGYRSVAGDSAQKLRGMLEEGKIRESAEFINSTAGGSCAHYCPDCDCVYCKDHLAVEAEWSGSWHTASYATCPVGHRRVFE